MEIKWISVKDKLPKDFEGLCQRDAVLVYSEGNGPGRHGIARYVCDKWEVLGNEGANSCTGFYDMCSDDITHWKELDFPDRLERLSGKTLKGDAIV